jgi:RHS repeat-associated protein
LLPGTHASDKLPKVPVTVSIGWGDFAGNGGDVGFVQASLGGKRTRKQATIPTGGGQTPFPAGTEAMTVGLELGKTHVLRLETAFMLVQNSTFTIPGCVRARYRYTDSSGEWVVTEPGQAPPLFWGDGLKLMEFQLLPESNYLIPDANTLNADGLSSVNAALLGHEIADWSLESTGAMDCKLEVLEGGRAARLVAGEKTGIVTLVAFVAGDCVYRAEIELVDCGGCTSCGAALGDGQPRLDDGPKLNMSLGTDLEGNSGSLLYSVALPPSTGVPSPASLQLTGIDGSQTQVLTTAGVLDQVGTASGAALVSSLSDGFQVTFFNTAQLAPQEHGRYKPADQNIFRSRWSYTNPDPSPQTNRIRITRTGAGLSTRVWTYTYVSSGANSPRWELEDGPDRRVWEITSSVGAITYTDRREQTAAGVVVSRVRTGRQVINDVPRLVEVVNGLNGRTNTITHLYQSIAPFYYLGFDHSDGPWERRTYDTAGRLASVRSRWNDATVASGDGRITEYLYEILGTPVVDDGAYLPTQPRVISESVRISGVTTLLRRSFHRWSPGTATTLGEHEERVVVSPSATVANDWALSDNLITLETRHTLGIGGVLGTDPEHAGELAWRRYPDATVEGFERTATATTRTVVTRRGEGTASGLTLTITRGTESTQVTGNLGELQSSIVRRIDGAQSLILVQDTYNYGTDPLKRNYTVTHLNGRTESRWYACCGLESETDEDGVVTSHLYDLLGRWQGSSRLGITTLDTLDAAGRMLVRTLSAQVNGQTVSRVLEEATYDDSGRTLTRKNEFGGVTTTADTLVSGHRLVTVTDPALGTTVEEYWGDGRLLKVTGTAARPLRKEYGVESVGGKMREFVRTVALNSAGADTPEVATSYLDAVGRTFRRTQAVETGAGNTAATAEHTTYFNAVGQVDREVDPDGVTRWTRYNAEGQPTRTAVDLVNPASLSFTQDRITENLTTYLAAANSGRMIGNVQIPVRRTETRIWKAEGLDAGLIVRRVDTSLDGLYSWAEEYPSPAQMRLTTSTTTFPASGQREVTITAPDNTRQVRRWVNGRLDREESWTSTPSLLTRVTYGYGPLGEVQTVTDLRQGTSTDIMTYLAAGGATRVSQGPAPGNGQPAPVTTTTYDTSGRAIGRTEPDGGQVTYTYHPTGLLQSTTGSRTYPVVYGYDAQGRMTTLKTYRQQGNEGVNSTATTTWVYHDRSGRLRSKAYAGEPLTDTEYTYSLAGRPVTRAWQRNGTTNLTMNLTTSYTTTSAGEVDVVTYSVGGSPEMQTAPIRFGYDRLGRRSTIKTYLPGTNATWILTEPSPSPVSTLSQTYNDLGEPETESWSGGPLAGRSVTTSWDSFGRRQGVTTSVAGFQAQNVTTYDPAGRPAIVTAGSHTATYRYVANSRLRAGVTYRANGTQRLDTQYDFDRLNRLQQVLNQPSAAGQPAERHAYTYNAAQQRIRDELVDGSSWNWEYDRLGQVIGGRKSWPDGNPVAGEQFEYGFDDIGNRVSQKRGGDANGANLRSTTYGVNPLNQITSRSVVGSRYLDLIGLAEPGTTVTAGGVIASRRGEFWRSELNLGTGNPLWQSVNITTSDGGSLANALYRVPPSSEVPTYDADGNLTADGLWTYTWDAENRLISMQSQALVPTAGRRKLDFEYDPLGRRIGRIVSTGASGSWVPTSTTRWLYEGWNPVAELNGAGTLVREYVWGTDLSGGWQGAGGVGGLLWVLEAPTGANAAHYTAYDGNGNVMGLVNATDGTWSARYEYGPFGEVVRATGTMAAANPFRWSTKIQDEDSGLNYYGYRYYSPGVGRWLGRDPIGENGGVNTYATTGGDFVNLIDYLGACCGSFAVIELPAVKVPAEQQPAAGGATQVPGFKVSWFSVAQTERGSDCCGCAPQNVKIVQAIENTGGGLSRTAHFDAGTDENPWRATPRNSYGGVVYPSYSGYKGPRPFDIADGPTRIPASKPTNPAIFSVNFCAVCERVGGDAVLGCIAFKFNDQTGAVTVAGLGVVKISGKDIGSFSNGEESYIPKGSPAPLNGWTVPCSATPAKVFRDAEKKAFDK